jgi:hypothetical protein
MLILRRKNHEPFMSALGHKRTFGPFIAMSALPPKADIHPRQLDFRFVPQADILRCSRDWRYSITSSAVASSFSIRSRGGTVLARRIRSILRNLRRRAP